MLVCEQDRDGGDSEPVEDADGQTEAGRGEADDRRRVGKPRTEKRAAHAETRDDRVQSLAPVDLLVEERVEAVEAGDPERDGGTEHPGLPRQLPGDRDPGSD